MATQIQEGNLSFDFADPWCVVKYDDSAYYRERLEPLKGQIDGKQKDTTGVDIVALHDELLAVIEVKDFRGFRIQNRPRITSGELAREVAFKVRDSLAGTIGAYRWGTDEQTWRPLAKAMTTRSRTLKVLLWLEQDRPPNTQREKQEFSTFTQELKKACRWLTTKVLVVSKATYANVLPDLTVEG